MKKLEKLKLNEMQDFSLMKPHEQMMLKGGQDGDELTGSKPCTGSYCPSSSGCIPPQSSSTAGSGSDDPFGL